MSGARSVGAAAPRPAPQPAPQVEAAIRAASQATGVDFSYMLGQARLESALDPGARASTSSAAGLYQFTQGTWLATVDRHGSKYGYGWADSAIVGGRVRDPAMRQQVMALRFDPQASALMAAELASDNADHLRGVLGREPDPSELYLAHFLGAGGAGKFLAALAANPSQSAAALFPKAAAANRAIFYTANGQPRSLAQVMDLIRTKMTRAMEGADSLGPAASSEAWAMAFDPGDEFAAAFPPQSGSAPSGPDGGEPAAPPPRPSMADTLASAFGGSGDAMPANVRKAYGTLQAFGL